MSKTNPAVETASNGYVALYIDRFRDGGIAFGEYSLRCPAVLRSRNPAAAITGVARARHVARLYHDWDLPTEEHIVGADPHKQDTEAPIQ